MSPLFEKAISIFDTYNSQDPNIELHNSTEYPKELLYSIRMTAILNDYYPNSSEALQLAARCQHICRWEIPRNDYKSNRGGYLKWRTTLYKLSLIHI